MKNVIISNFNSCKNISDIKIFLSYFKSSIYFTLIAQSYIASGYDIGQSIHCICK